MSDQAAAENGQASTLDGDLSYGEALEELEQLLDDLEGADTDVDLLAQRVARGVELVRFCRARLEVVAEDVDAVVAELISVDGETETQDADADSADADADDADDVPEGDQ